MNYDWDGKGLPAVGDVCMCGTHEREVEILQIDAEQSIAACRAIDNNDLFHGWGFRKIKSADDLAKDVRLKALQEWVRGIEAEYGPEVSGKCYDILMDAEALKPSITG